MQYKQHLQKDWQFYRRLYRRNVTRRYFTESCKTITAFCHNHRRVYRWNVSRRYFTESCKTITAFCHNHRQVYRRTCTRWYFIESCKKITALAIITDEYTDSFTDEWCTFQSARLSDCLSVGTGTDGFADGHDKSNAPVVWHIITDEFTDERRKIWRDFWNFWCEHHLNTDGNYRRNLMPPPKKYYSMFRW